MAQGEDKVPFFGNMDRAQKPTRVDRQLNFGYIFYMNEQNTK